MEEVWKRIQDFPDYEISNRGRIITYKQGKKAFIKPRLLKYGYYCVHLYVGGKRKACKIHRLVLVTFGDQQPPNTTVDHINRDRLDNRIENLRWATQEEQTLNTKPSYGENHHSNKLTEAQVLEILEKIKAQTQTQASIAREYGVKGCTISNIKAGRKWGYLNRSPDSPT
jgi:hypothetical protein